MAIKDPTTPDEWQQAVDAAAFWILLDDARLYGLVTFSTQVDRDRCLTMLARGRRQGVLPSNGATKGAS